MKAAFHDIQSGLSALLGESSVVDGAAAQAAAAVDGITPQCVVYPSSAAEVAAALRWAAEHDLAVIPCGGATKLGVGNPPRRYDLALSLKEMNRVTYFEPADLTISAEAGMKFGDFQELVGRQGLWLPLDPLGGGYASVGGIVATNAAGPLRLMYGAPRDMVLGMKIVTTEGKIIKAGGRVVKNVTGYDIGKLLIGSYGTLGVIVEATFKLFPLPPERASFVLNAGTLGIARDLRRRILASPISPARCVLLSESAARLAMDTKAQEGAPGPLLLLELHGSKRRIERARRDLEELATAAGTKPEILEATHAESAWTRVTDHDSGLAKDHLGMPVLKAALPGSASEEFVSRAEQEAAGDKAECAVIAQLGVGIVHVCVLSELSVEAQASLIGRLRTAAESLGGTLIIKRCPLPLKQQLDVWGSPGSDFELMKRMKHVWDPNGILSPGRMIRRL